MTLRTPPRTYEEAKLRERLVEAESRAERYERLAMAQDQVVKAAQAIRSALPAPGAALGRPVANLVQALDALARVVLLGSTGAVAPSRIAILAIQAHTHGTDRWEFDSATSCSEAYEKLRKWNERAAREWPDMRFTLKDEP